MQRQMTDPRNQDNSTSGSVVRVGPAGWSYPDWKGLVYPQPAPRGFDPLTYLAGYFDTIEINSSFYRPPRARSAGAWAQRVRGNPNFRFTAKLYRRFTHEISESPSEDERVFRQGIAPLREASLLGALLLQFPWSFKNDAASRSYFRGLLDRFADLPLVVEVRHSSWNDAEVYQELSHRGVGFCNIDQPLFARSLEPSATVTSPIGYVRLHGRNYDHWFAGSSSSAERYNYLYDAEELRPWIDRVRRIAASASAVYVITNNHFEGKGVVNALEIRSQLQALPVRVPEQLPIRFPRLAAIRLSDEGEQWSLLDARERQ